jgi:hypothetical protein
MVLTCASQGSDLACMMSLQLSCISFLCSTRTGLDLSTRIVVKLDCRKDGLVNNKGKASDALYISITGMQRPVKHDTDLICTQHES